jgi:hypothetical protein
MIAHTDVYVGPASRLDQASEGLRTPLGLVERLFRLLQQPLVLLKCFPGLVARLHRAGEHLMGLLNMLSRRPQRRPA